MEGEKLVRRACPEPDSGLTNSIRPVVTVSLPGNGEAQTFEREREKKKRKSVKLTGIPDRGSDCIRSQSLHRSEEAL